MSIRFSRGQRVAANRNISGPRWPYDNKPPISTKSRAGYIAGRRCFAASATARFAATVEEQESQFDGRLRWSLHRAAAPQAHRMQKLRLPAPREACDV